MLVSRWASTILMFMSVLLNWSALSAICVGAPVERDEQDVQEEDMEDEGMEEVGEMGDSDGMDSSEETVHDLTSPQ